MPHPCEGCGHFYGYYRNNRCCNYIFDSGHRRPCPAGKGCTEYLPRLSDGAFAVPETGENSALIPDKQEEI